jgi:hypothetical protein
VSTCLNALIAETRAVIAHKQIYRVMKVRDLLLDGHAAGAERRHDGRITVDERYRHVTPTASRLAVTTVRRSESPSRAVYIGRWMTAPMEHEDGTKAERKSGNPPGGVVNQFCRTSSIITHSISVWC